MVEARQSIFAGIEIGGTKLQIFVEASGKVIESHRLATKTSEGAIGIRKQIENTLSPIAQKMKLTGVGVGFGGPVDWKTGKVCCSHQIQGWSEFNLSEWLTGLTGAPTFADNDANVAALAEAALGAGRSASPMFYVTLGSGVGGGLVVDGKIYHGAIPGEAEIGHMRVDRSGATIESRCSGWAVDQKIRALNSSEPANVLYKLSHKHTGGEACHLATAIAQNDATARRILRETAEDLAFGLSHVAHLFHPEVIVIGGGLAAIGNPLRAAVAAALKTFTMEAFAPGPKVCLAELEEKVVPMGAIELARRGIANK